MKRGEVGSQGKGMPDLSGILLEEVAQKEVAQKEIRVAPFLVRPIWRLLSQSEC